jgi:hypothetical protein
VPKAAADRGVAWATIAIGIAGSLLAVGAIAWHRRPHEPHRARTHHRVNQHRPGCRPPHRHPGARRRSVGARLVASWPTPRTFKHAVNSAILLSFTPAARYESTATAPLVADVI